MYRQYRSKLLGFITLRVGDRGLAEDILHDVFAKVITREDSLREPAKLTGWLYKVTRNAIIDRLRSNRPFVELPREIEAENEESTAEAKLAACLQPMIEALPETYREAVMLSEIDGMPLKRIAEGQRITLSGVKSRVQRGRQKLEVMLRDCCALEFSRDGTVMDFSPKASSGRPCCNS